MASIKGGRAQWLEGRRTIDSSPGAVCLNSKFSSYKQSQVHQVLVSSLAANDLDSAHGIEGMDLKLVAVDGPAACAVVLEEVSALDHEVLDDTASDWMSGDHTQYRKTAALGQRCRLTGGRSSS